MATVYVCVCELDWMKEIYLSFLGAPEKKVNEISFLTAYPQQPNARPLGAKQLIS